MVWQDARKKACFDTFKPYLSRLIDFNKKMADYIDSSKATYDVLLDAYEPGITAAQIKLLFDPLKTETVALLNKIQTRSKTFKTFQDKRFDCDKQWAYTLDILKDMGFDFERGRQDKSTHPFTIHMHPSDVRVTTRLNDKDPFEAITSTIHEGGHGLYEQGLPEQYFGTPLGESVSLGIHESQSRLWENHVGRSLAFWESQYAAFASYFPKELSDITATDLFEMVNVVQPGPIRVEADEVSYNLHVLIRFEIESALFDGSLQVHQLPEAWNAAYQNYLNVTVQNDAEGVLQDIHWAGGSFGYFPTYTIGTLMAAQLFDQIETEFPTLNTDIRSNQLLGIKRWLNEHIHAYGREYMANELIEKATGKPFSSTYYLNYMKQKYSALYALQS